MSFPILLISHERPRTVSTLYPCVHTQASGGAENAEPEASPEEVVAQAARAREAAAEASGMQKVFEAAADSSDAVLRAVARDEEQSLRDAYSSANGGKRSRHSIQQTIQQHDCTACTCMF